MENDLSILLSLANIGKRGLVWFIGETRNPLIIKQVMEFELGLVPATFALMEAITDDVISLVL